MTNLEVYIGGALTVSSMLMCWFNTNLPIHIVHVLKILGWRKHDTKIWESDTPIEFWTKVDLTSWKQRVLPAWLDELTECPGCLSVHFSFWFALFISAITWRGAESFVLFVLACGGWPYISNIALAKLKASQHFK